MKQKCCSMRYRNRVLSWTTGVAMLAVRFATLITPHELSIFSVNANTGASREPYDRMRLHFRRAGITFGRVIVQHLGHFF